MNKHTYIYNINTVPTEKCKVTYKSNRKLTARTAPCVVRTFHSFLLVALPTPAWGVKAPRSCAGAAKCVTRVDERWPRPTSDNWATISDSTAGALTPRGEMPIFLLYTLSLDVVTWQRLSQRL